MVPDIREQTTFKGSQEHLDVLLYAIKKNDIDFWNRWREEHHDQKVLLSGARLINSELSGINLSHADLRDVNLSGADLSEGYLADTDFSGADLSRACLRKADLSRATFKDAYCNMADFSHAHCLETTVMNANFAGSNLTHANMGLSKLCSTDLTDSNLIHCSLSGALLENVTFTGAAIGSWKIKGCKTRALTCEYIYIDNTGVEKLPKNRKFRTGEFEGYIRKLQESESAQKKSIQKSSSLRDVFISYADEDYDYVKNMADMLEKNGIRVWLERERLQAGVTWQEALKNAIKNSVYFIICFTKKYCDQLETTYVEELEIAFENLQTPPERKPWFIPVKLLRCNIPEIVNKKMDRENVSELIDLTQGWNKGIQKAVELINR